MSQKVSLGVGLRAKDTITHFEVINSMQTAVKKFGSLGGESGLWGHGKGGGFLGRKGDLRGGGEGGI